jgi:chitinase
VVEGHTGVRPATFTVKLTSSSNVPVTVQFATVDGLATAGADYTATTGILTFGPGQTIQTVTVPVLGDRLREADETFSLALSNHSEAVIHTGTATAFISDDEPRLDIFAGSVKEGRKETTTWLEFTITLSAAYDVPVTVTFATQNNSAMAGSDYEATSGTFTFAPGETSKIIRVKVYGDKRREGNESVALRVSDSLNPFWELYGYGVITDDD